MTHGPQSNLIWTFVVQDKVIYLPTTLFRKIKQLIVSVRPTVHLFTLSLLNSLTLNLSFCLWIGHVDLSSPGIESLGHSRGLGLGLSTEYLLSPDWFYLPGFTFLMLAHPGSPRHHQWCAKSEICSVSEWQWHQLGHMQICTSPQAYNHVNTPSLSYLQTGCPSCCPANSVNAPKVTHSLLQMKSETPFKAFWAPPNLPFLYGHVDPRLIHQCLSQPHSTSQMTAPSVHALSHNYAPKSSLVTVGCHKLTPKIAPSPLAISTPFNTPIPWPTPLTIPNGIQIQSAVLTQFTLGNRDIQTDTH